MSSCLIFQVLRGLNILSVLMILVAVLSRTAELSSSLT